MHSVIRMAPVRATLFPPRRAARLRGTFIAAALSAFCTGPVLASCGSAFCSINTDWGAGTAGLAEGSAFDLRYEHIRQDQPRTGSRRVAVGEVPRHHDEVRTLNRNLVGTYSHTFGSGWGVSVTLPFVDRDHLHVHNHRGTTIPEQWSLREVGDVRVTGRYQVSLPASADAPRTLAAFAGLKLPTGKTGVANASGEVAERSLQPGSGTTDLVVGGVFHQQLAGGAAWFAQAQLQQPLNTHDGFRAGAQLGVDLGYAHPLGERFSGLLQLNLAARRRDRGAQAEPADSGSRSVFLSPGASWRASDAVRVYAYYQHPLQQHVNGVQLTARRAFVLGLTTHF